MVEYRTKSYALIETGGGPPFVVEVAEGGNNPAMVICEGAGNDDCVFMSVGKFGARTCGLKIGSGNGPIECKSTFRHTE